MSKKLSIIMLAAVLAFALTACSNDSIAKLSDEQLVSELVQIDKNLKEAATKGDKSAAEKILAAEYKMSMDGKPIEQTREKTLEVYGKASNRNYPSAQNPKLVSRTDNSATIAYDQISRIGIGNSVIEQKSKVTQSYVRRDGRWQIISDDARTDRTGGY